jgi:hypothetical protein
MPEFWRRGIRSGCAFPVRSPSGADRHCAAFSAAAASRKASGDAELTVVREFAGRRNAPQFVIASAFKQHTLEAFELGVVDYLRAVEAALAEGLRIRCLRPPQARDAC